jgi:AmmeMemoRadiSam system protein A
MEPTPLPEITLDSTLRQKLLEVAIASIRHGLTHGSPLLPPLDEQPDELQQERAAFVTLHSKGQLRGCIGHLQALQPLITDVAENAFAAAFRDPRFPPLTQPELQGLEVHLSILTPPTPLEFSSEDELLAQLRPGVDGLILKDGGHQGTFLPSVWESLPEPGPFLRNLKMKAGLSADHWSPSLRVDRYTTESFSNDTG